MSTAADQQIARKIERHLAAKGLKRRRVIDALGIGYQAFERRMSGRIAFNVHEIAILAETLHVSPADLLPDDWSADEVAA